MLQRISQKNLKGSSLLKDFTKLGEKFRVSCENFNSLNEELNKNFALQQMYANLFLSFINLHNNIGITSKQVLSKVISILNFDGGTIHLYRDHKKQLQLLASQSVPEDFLEIIKELYISGDVIGHSNIKNSETIVLNYSDLTLSTKKTKNITKKSSNVVIFIPIRVNKELIGILTLLSSKEQEINDSDRQIYNILSNYIGLGLKNNLLFEETKNLATKDGLTDLHNRIYFQEFLSLELNRSKRYKKPLSLAIMDIDFFKKINDTYGHLAGDSILKEFADILKQSFRKTDLVARYGGEEFVVVFPEADTNNTIKVISKFQKKLNEHFFQSNGEKHKITISMGISAFTPEKKISQNELIERADKALYTAKECGRNRVEVWNM